MRSAMGSWGLQQTRAPGPGAPPKHHSARRGAPTPVSGPSSEPDVWERAFPVSAASPGPRLPAQRSAGRAKGRVCHSSFLVFARNWAPDCFLSSDQNFKTEGGEKESAREPPFASRVSRGSADAGTASLLPVEAPSEMNESERAPRTLRAVDFKTCNSGYSVPLGPSAAFHPACREARA